VITEKTIAQLLTLPHLGGKRIQGKDNKSSFVRNTINKEIFSNYSPDKKEYKAKDLIPQLRTWHKIILGCINPRPSTSSSDYINANQKYMLYYLMKHERICLPSILFYYLRVLKTWTTADESKKVPNYIPFGRLLSDIFVENGLVAFLEEARFTQDLEASVGDVLNAKNLKNMGVLKTIIVDPTPESQEQVLKKRQVVDNFPLFSKLDDPEVVAHYIMMMEEEGIDMSGFNYDDLPDAPELVELRKRSKKRKSEKPKKKESKKQKKDKDIGLSSYSEPSKGTSTKTSSGTVITSTHSDTIPTPPTSQQTTPPSQTTTHTSTQILTPIPSEPIQTTTPAII
jgi:hypothetical protein